MTAIPTRLSAVLTAKTSKPRDCTVHVDQLSFARRQLKIYRTMPITTDTDGSEDVNDFLLRIRDLSRKRDIEDEERTKKLEEEIIQGRKERQARRAGLQS